MGLFDEISTSEPGAPVKEVAKQLDIPENDVAKAFEKLVPALAGSLKRQSEQEDDEDQLLAALKGSNHERYLERPETTTTAESIEDGNKILGHLFGSKDVSREVAKRAAQQTQLDPGVLKKLLPIVATLSMGALKKQATNRGMLTGQRSRAGGRERISVIVDSDGDGSIIDDLLEKVRRR